MKKLFATLICAVMCITPLASCDKECTDHVDENEDGICDVCSFEYEFIFKLTADEAGYELDRVGPAYKGGDVVIPSEYKGLPVTQIGYDAFESEYKLTAVVIPDSVTLISDDAFENQTSLTSVNAGKCVVTIGVSAFEDCTNLKTVVISDATEYIYASAFEGCTSLETVTLGKNVKEIAGSVFEDCTSLKTITIPASIEKMGSWVFNGNNMTDIYFGVPAPNENWKEKWNEGLNEGVNIHWNENSDSATGLSTIFKTAYANSFTEDFEVDLNNITILNYYGMISDAHIVSIDSTYLDKRGYPNGVYIESVEGMEFRYDLSYKVYIIYNEVLYTAKSAYENQIIDFDGLCKVFGLHTSNIPTFNKVAYDKLKSFMELNYQEESDLYELKKYYGEYNDYYAVSYNYLGTQACVTANEPINNLNFEYGYESSHIRFMNGTEMHSIYSALIKGIINDKDLYDLFEIHTKSEEVDAELITQLLTPAYELCLKYKDDFIMEDVNFQSFYLTKYYGKYGNSYIYSLRSSCWISHNSASASPEEIELMEYGFSDIAYVLNDGKLYTLDQALKSGIITNEIKNEIITKYYN